MVLLLALVDRMCQISKDPSGATSISFLERLIKTFGLSRALEVKNLRTRELNYWVYVLTFVY